jgi:hypothetical protein
MRKETDLIPSAGKIRGRYANYFRVGFNAFEFVIDFGQLYSEKERATLHTRVITNPEIAKNLNAILQDSLAQYSENYEDISSHEDD